MSILKVLLLVAWLVAAVHLLRAAEVRAPTSDHAFASLRLAINDRIATHGLKYPHGRDYLARLDALEPAVRAGEAEAAQQFESLRREALLANPALNFDTLLVVRRKHVKPPEKTWNQGQWAWAKDWAGRELGLPSNHECYQSTNKLNWDNEIATVSLQGPENWKIWEIDADGTKLRQVSQMPADVDCMDPCYLPDGSIVFGSTAPIQAVPCWHGLRRVTNLYRMNADGTGVRQLCFDQDHDLHPHVLPNGQVLYNRWEYTAVAHMYQRTLMVMNPDGTGQRGIYGSNSYYPNAMYFAKPLPGDSSRFALILSGYHGPHRMGQLIVLDTTRGFFEADGIVGRISGRGEPARYSTTSCCCTRSHRTPAGMAADRRTGSPTPGRRTCPRPHTRSRRGRRDETRLDSARRVCDGRCARRG